MPTPEAKLRAAVAARLPAASAAQLGALLAEAGDPELALRQLAALQEQHPAEARRALATPEALRGCLLLLGASQWLGQTLLQNPDLLQLLARPAMLAAERSPEDLAEHFARMRLRMHASPLPELLARFKRREYVRIFLRELLGLAALAEITSEISALADVLIGQALEHCESELRRRAEGWPAVKVPSAGEKNRVSPARFAVLALGKLGGNELNYSSDIDLLFLFDDAEDAGSMTMPAREFFTRLAQELTAVLCHLGGEGQLYRVDLRLRPQGASGEIAVGCAQALRYYRGEAADWELQALVKLRCAAGDRTLAREFIDQVQPLVYAPGLSLAAIETAARSLERIRRGNTRAVGAKDARAVDVKSAPGGIREIEFLVQCLQRVHAGDEPWLRSSGTLAALQKLHDKGYIGGAEWRQLAHCYRLLRALEHRLQCRQGLQTHRLGGGPREQAALLRSLAEPGLATVDELQRMMRAAAALCAQVLTLGPGEPQAEAARLGSQGSERLTRELSASSPRLAEALAAATLGNLQRFLAGAATSEERIRHTVEHAALLEQALPVFEGSALATELLARHPEDLPALFGSLPPESQATRADQLRIAARRLALRTVGSSVLEAMPVWQVLAGHTLGMEQLMREALEEVGAPPGFAVLAVGRMGTCELDLLSDADLVFVRGPECPGERAERCARELVTVLSAYTREGSAIAVDSRVRPHGSAGELVASLRQLTQYFQTEAKGWELLAFSKLRWIGGDTSAAAEAVGALDLLRRRYAGAPGFAAELRAVRRRLEESSASESFKTGPGGLYDLDFIVGLLEARSGRSSAGRQLRQRIESLSADGALSPEQGSQLQKAIGLFRRIDHALRVVEGRSRKWLPSGESLRSRVELLAGAPRSEGQLRAAMAATRRIFSAVFND